MEFCVGKTTKKAKIKRFLLDSGLFDLVLQRGFEPRTPCLKGMGKHSVFNRFRPGYCVDTAPLTYASSFAALAFCLSSRMWR